VNALVAVRLLDSLKQRLLVCSPDELRVLDVLLKRLELGRERYGLLDLSKPRNWKKEKAEEDLDSAIYEAADILSKEDELRERAECEAADDFAEKSPVEFSLREFTTAAKSCACPPDCAIRNFCNCRCHGGAAR
jgi:hypothetical protein